MSHLQWTDEDLKNYRARRMLDAVALAPTPPLYPSKTPGVEIWMDGTPVRDIPRSLQTTPEKVSPGKAKTGPKAGSKIEELLAFQIKAAGLPEPVREYRHIPGRRFRLDFAWVDQKIGVECQGMVHRIKRQFENDIFKRQLGLMAGWRILEVSGKTVRSGQAVLWIAQLLNGQQAAQPARVCQSPETPTP